MTAMWVVAVTAALVWLALALDTVTPHNRQGDLTK